MEHGDSLSRRPVEVAALRRGLELGMQVIDTAEMYGDGRSETLVGEAIRGLREQVYLVSKVPPSHTSAEGTVTACEASLKRLGRILENAPKTFTAAHLRVLLRAVVNLDPYTYFRLPGERRFTLLDECDRAAVIHGRWVRALRHDRDQPRFIRRG